MLKYHEILPNRWAHGLFIAKSFCFLLLETHSMKGKVSPDSSDDQEFEIWGLANQRLHAETAICPMANLYPYQAKEPCLPTAGPMVR